MLIFVTFLSMRRLREESKRNQIKIGHRISLFFVLNLWIFGNCFEFTVKEWDVANRRFIKSSIISLHIIILII